MENSLGTATALAPHIGYANASKIAKQALKENRKLKELILEHNLMTKEKLEEIAAAVPTPFHIYDEKGFVRMRKR